METAFTKKIAIFLICFVFIMLCSMGTPQVTVAEDTIKIVLLEPFSGPTQDMGNMYYEGTKFAIDEQNSKGGLLGKRIKIIKADTEFKPEVALRKAKELILHNNADFLGIGMGSHIEIALHKLINTHKKILINYGCISDDLTGKEFSRYAFRITLNGHQACSAMVQLMATRRYKRIYIMGVDILFAHQTSRALKEQLKIHMPDVKIVGEDFHPVNTKDFGPYISKIIATKADVVFGINFGGDATRMISQARALGLAAPFPFAMPILADPAVVHLLKDDAVGILSTFHYCLWVKTPANQNFIAKWHEKHKKDKDAKTMWPALYTGSTPLGWKMFFAAVEKAGSLDTEKIINTFEGFWHETPVGWWSMRKCDHQLIMPMFAGEIQAGWNPWYNGSINPDVKMPWIGQDIKTFGALGLGTAIPPTSDYNPRCP